VSTVTLFTERQSAVKTCIFFLFSNLLCSFLKARDYILHSYKTNSKIVSYILSVLRMRWDGIKSFPS
jgi:hypothetical protein